MQLVQSLIKEGGVDSHCFAVFAVPGGLGDAEAVRVRSFVPEGQEGCGASLLVMLQEEGGAVYYAQAGRSLADAEWQTSTVWLDSFQLGGWATDADGRLDVSKVSRVLFGWGGYFGKDDERVCFGLGDIELLSLGE